MDIRSFFGRKGGKGDSNAKKKKENVAETTCQRQEEKKRRAPTSSKRKIVCGKNDRKPTTTSTESKGTTTTGGDASSSSAPPFAKKAKLENSKTSNVVMSSEARGREKKKKKKTPSSSSSSSSSTTKTTTTPNKRVYRDFSKKRPGPLKKRENPLPVGAPTCLQGNTFVITGILNTLEREEAEEYIKDHGGQVRKAMSGKTTFLLSGEFLEDGRKASEGSKTQKALSMKQCSIIGEEDLINMVRESQGREKTAAAAAAPASNTNMTMPSGGGAAKGRSSSSGEVSYKMTNVRGAKAAVTKRESDSRHVLWSVKHRPKIPKDLIGNSQNILRLTNWLKNWSRKYNTSSSSSKSGGKKKRPKMNAAQLKSFNAQRGAILSGPPGIGKTSAASLVAKHLGFEVVEFNASDKRSKGVMHTLSEAVNSRVMTFGGGSKRNATTSSRGRVVIMDEVDGMSSGDRGGAAALADVIRTSRSPVICICNDLQKKSLSSLRSVCLGLPFRRPNRASIAKRMQAVARSEGLLIEDSAMEALVEGVGNDIRQVLNALQMMSRRHVGGGGKGGGQQQQPVRYSEMKTRLQAISKDSILRMTAFTGAQEIFNTRSAPLNKRYESFFVDYSLIPLMVQENYPSVLANARGSDQSEKVERMCRAAEAVANSDMLSASTGGTMNWSLLKYQAALNVEAAFHANGFCGQVNFPAWFGKYSKRNGRRRLLRELSTHMSGSGVSASCGPNALRLDNYMHALRAALMSPLIAKGQDGIEAALEGLRVYGLSREDLMEKMPEFEIQIGRPSGSARTPPPSNSLTVPTKVKTAFTRAYNTKGGRVSQGVALTAEAGVNKDKVKLFKKNTGKGKKKKRKSGSGKKGGGSKRKR